jgi:hypothetical protein
MLQADQGSSASQALLAAALGGLLCVAVGCSTSSTAGSNSAAGSSSVSASNGDTPIPATECDGGVSPNPQVTSSAVLDLTQDQFAKQCAARNGTFEIQPHCGGSNSCRGMSYDLETTALTEHSCRATNTCAGYSCVVCG